MNIVIIGSIYIFFHKYNDIYVTYYKYNDICVTYYYDDICVMYYKPILVSVSNSIYYNSTALCTLFILLYLCHMK